MPTIPTYDTQVDLRALPDTTTSANLSPDAFGAAVGRGVENLGSSLEQIYKQRQAKAEAERKHQEAVKAQDQDLEMDTTEAQVIGEAEKSQGINALGAVDTALKSYDAQAQKMRGTIDNPEARQLFDLKSAARRSSLNLKLERRARSEADGAADESYKATILNSQDLITKNSDDPARVALELARQERAVIDNGSRKGLPPNVIAEQIAATKSAARTIQIGQAVDSGDYTRASGMLKEFGKELHPRDAEKMTKDVRSAVIDGTAKDLAASVLRSTNKDGSALDEQQAMELIAKGAGGNKAIQDKAEQRVLADIRQARAAYNDAQSMTELKIWNAIAQDPQAGQSQTVQNLMRTLDPQRAEALNAHVAKALEPDPIKSRIQLGVYQNKMLGKGNEFLRDQILENGPTTAIAGMNKEDALAAVTLYNTMFRESKGDKKAAKDMHDLRTEHEVIKPILDAAFGTTFLADENGRVKAMEFINAEAQFEQAKRKDGSKLTPTELQIIAKKAVADTVIQGGSWWGGKRHLPVYQAVDEFVSQIPQAWRDDHTWKFTEKNGRPPISDETMDDWIRHVDAHPEDAPGYKPPAPPSAIPSGATIWDQLNDMANPISTGMKRTRK